MQVRISGYEFVGTSLRQYAVYRTHIATPVVSKTLLIRYRRFREFYKQLSSQDRELIGHKIPRQLLQSQLQQRAANLDSFIRIASIMPLSSEGQYALRQLLELVDPTYFTPSNQDQEVEPLNQIEKRKRRRRRNAKRRRQRKAARLGAKNSRSGVDKYQFDLKMTQVGRMLETNQLLQRVLKFESSNACLEYCRPNDWIRRRPSMSTSPRRTV